MSIQPAFVAVVADSLGLKPHDDAAKALAPDVEYRLREIIQEAAKFMRRSKRPYLTPEDVNNALRLRNVEPLYGFGGRDPARFVRAAGHPDVFHTDDHEVALDQIIDRPLPRAPVEVGVVPHWLAIDGRQPAIPENQPAELALPKKRARPSGGLPAAAAAKPAAAPRAAVPAPAAGGTAPSAGGAEAEKAGALVRAPVRHVLPQELHLYFDKVAVLLRAPAEQQAGEEEEEEEGGGAAAAPAPAVAELKQLRRAVLCSLARDPGLHPLAPYLVQLIATEIGSSLQRLPHLSLLLSAARALVSNEDVALGPHLHELMPAVMTCMLAKQLGGPAGGDHWAVRDQAAAVLARIVAAYGDSHPNLLPRVQKTLLRALSDASKPPATHYGAIRGLAALGPATVRLLLLPCLPALAAALRHAPGGGDAAHARAALVQAVGDCVFLRMLPQAAATRHALQASGEAAGGDAAVRAEADAALLKLVAPAAAAPASRAAAAATPSGAEAPARPRGKTAKAAAPKRKAGGRSRAAQAAAPAQPADWLLYFAEPAPEEEAAQLAADAEAAAAWQRRWHAALAAAGDSMRPADAGSRAEVGGGELRGAAPVLADALADAWREDCDAERVAAVVYELLGDDLLPYLPAAVAAAAGPPGRRRAAAPLWLV